MRLTCLSVVVVVAAVVVVVSVHGQKVLEREQEPEGCVPCEEMICPKKPTNDECPWGRVREPCHCCDECAKGPGEVCGSKLGTCLPGFKCIKRESAPKGGGRCEWVPLPTFHNPKIPGK